ncbi:NSFL1 cofactor p47-like [Oppia nitens]|uniref:NSFL1 cofactor p47-like n=1 Tax=Oppia nitens TaxID=1686743 RepID=UPI0023DC3522|nr:NSFL1 cofactor p47-like [Oppia nitens]
MDTNPQSKDELISNFCGITGVEASRGEFYLESANWDLSLAIQSFYETATEDIAIPTNAPNPQTSEEQKRAHELQQMFSNKPIHNTSDNSSDDEMPLQAMTSKDSAKSSKNTQKSHLSSNIATLGSLKPKSDSGEGESDEEGQAFYAGGSEHSGQQVLGPKKKNTDKLVQNMFQSAKEHGAEVIDPNEEVSAQRRINSFGGHGFKLGSTSEQPSAVSSQFAVHNQKQNRDMILKFWRNGFSIDDGPLREYNDPQNQEFLNSIKKGEIPRELIQQSGGQEVHLNLEDHKHEDFIPPKKSMKLFAGEGHRLGSPAADVVITQTLQSNFDPKVTEAEAVKQLKVDETKPTTSIQIRLTDGSRLVVKLNITHTIADIRHFICTSRPIYSAQSFGLMTTFPNKELTDETLSIKDANLLNASIVQRIK